jgi:hypothetical protein
VGGTGFSNVAVHVGAPAYADHFQERSIVSPPPSQTGTRIKYADLMVTVDAIDHLVDFNVTGPTKDILETAARTTGAMAKAGETRKVNEVLRHYHVLDHLRGRVVPFVLEATGTFGQRATRFLKHIINSFALQASPGADPDDLAALPEDDSVEPGPAGNGDGSGGRGRSAFGTRRARMLWRFKEGIAGAVHKKNASMLRDYVRMMDAVLYH